MPSNFEIIINDLCELFETNGEYFQFLSFCSFNREKFRLVINGTPWIETMDIPCDFPRTTWISFWGRSTIEFMTTVLSYSLRGLSMLLNLTVDSFAKDSFNSLCTCITRLNRQLKLLSESPSARLTRGIWVQE